MKLSWNRSKAPAVAMSNSAGGSVTRALSLPPTFVVDADLLSDVGCVRTNNEDTGRIARDSQAVPGRSRTLIVVADGMGGHNAGEVASALAAETMEAAFGEMTHAPARTLQRAMTEANRRIFTESRDNAERSGMGTTCTALLLQDGQAFSAHVGDSRIYLLRNGGIYLVTEDHSQVMEMVKAGLISLDEARHHPDKNVITRALGRQAQVEVATWPQPMQVQVGDSFLLCSDGICDVLEDDELNTTASSLSAADACEAMVQLARSRHAADNLTVAVVKLLPFAGPNALPVPTDAEAAPLEKASRPTRRVELTP